MVAAHYQVLGKIQNKISEIKALTVTVSYKHLIDERSYVLFNKLIQICVPD